MPFDNTHGHATVADLQHKVPNSALFPLVQPHSSRSCERSTGTNFEHLLQEGNQLLGRRMRDEECNECLTKAQRVQVRQAVCCHLSHHRGIPIRIGVPHFVGESFGDPVFSLMHKAIKQQPIPCQVCMQVQPLSLAALSQDLLPSNSSPSQH